MHHLLEPRCLRLPCSALPSCDDTSPALAAGRDARRRDEDARLRQGAEVPVPFAEAVKLGKHGGDRRSEKAKEQGDNVTLDRGNSASYTLARLDRDRPELAERVRAGELSAIGANAGGRIFQPRSR